MSAATVLIVDDEALLRWSHPVHGEVSRAMWAPLFPGYREADVPIGHLTNGVHVPSWLAPQMRQLSVACVDVNGVPLAVNVTDAPTVP